MSINPNQQMQVVHGFNEELTIILNTAALASKLLGPEHPASAAIGELQRAVNRCADLTRKLTC
jgi:hypothetical protein